MPFGSLSFGKNRIVSRISRIPATKFARSSTKLVRSRLGAKGRSSASGIRRSRRGKKELVFLIRLTGFALTAILVGTVLIIVIFAYFSRELPNPSRLIERRTELATKIMDRDGEVLYEVFGEKNRSLVELSQVSPHVINATLATEDSDFYLHQGFSPRGMARAIRNTWLKQQGLQGGSTLTQQVVKNSLLTRERTISRKIKELMLSLQIENSFSKEQIIQMYLNETPYGGQNYGILTASKSYFDKLPSELSIAEAAYLAGLPQRPSYYSQYGSNPEAGLERKDYVLHLMYERGWTGSDEQRHFITEEEYEAAKGEELEFQRAKAAFKAPHFVFYAKNILADMFGEEMIEQGGLEVRTTLDYSLQEMAQEIVYNEVEKASYLNVGNGGLVVIDPKTGQILAMVGSKGYSLDSEPEGCTSGIGGEEGCVFEPNVNVTTVKRQPGSAIKPVTYATMLSQGYTTSFPFLDVPTQFPGSAPDKPYKPENYDGMFRGPMPLRKALGNSINLAAVKALKIVGIDNMIEQAEKMGITTFTERHRYGLALTLGGGETKLLELTNAYAVFANKGVYLPPTPVLEVKNAAGEVIYEYSEKATNQAVSEEVAFLISDILSDDGARSAVFGAGSLLHISGYQVAVKTGTTDDKRDNYAIGFTPSIVAGSWVGNNNNVEMNPYLASGISGATPIWRRFMLAYFAKAKADGKEPEKEKFDPPKTIEKVAVDRLTGMLPYDDEESRYEWFRKGNEPATKSSWYQKLEICKIDGKLASEDCKKADETETKTFVHIMAELPEWQTDVDKWVHENYSGESKYFPPTTISHLEFDDDGDVKDSSKVYVNFVGLKDYDVVPLSFRLGVEVSAKRDIDRVNIYLDGKEITSDGSEPFGYNFSFSMSDAGEHEFEAVARDEKGNKGEETIILRVGGQDYFDVRGAKDKIVAADYGDIDLEGNVHGIDNQEDEED